MTYGHPDPRHLASFSFWVICIESACLGLQIEILPGHLFLGHFEPVMESFPQWFAVRRRGNQMLAGPRATEEVGLATAAVLVGIKCRQGTGALRVTSVIQVQAAQEEQFISVPYLLK